MGFSVYGQDMADHSFDLTYNKLPEFLFQEIKPERAPDPQMYWINDSLAAQLGLSSEWLSSSEALDLFSGRKNPEKYTPIAMAYAGHQFGHLSPQLGDGRAVLIGEQQVSDRRFDIHLKGSGKTQYSRRGDGKSTLRAALKEVLFSEFLTACNIPSSRSLAVFTTGETVARQRTHPGAVLARSAQSLIRVGTFQFAALNGSSDDIRKLADYTINRLMDPGTHSYADLLKYVLTSQARLIAQWMAIGFIHGVMNTDNMALSGETIDFGPCAMMERFRPDQVFSSIDHYGRYAWQNQADIGLWNLSRLAESLLPILDESPEKSLQLAEDILGLYPEIFRTAFREALLPKIGIEPRDDLPDGQVSALISALAEARLDYTLFFRALSDALHLSTREPVLDLCENPMPMNKWLDQWDTLMAKQDREPDTVCEEMDAINPFYVPRLQWVEEALNAAEAGNRAPFETLLSAIQSPFSANKDFDFMRAPTPPDPAYGQTFCET